MNKSLWKTLLFTTIVQGVCIVTTLLLTLLYIVYGIHVNFVFIISGLFFSFYIVESFLAKLCIVCDKSSKYLGSIMAKEIPTDKDIHFIRKADSLTVCNVFETKHMYIVM